jgi:hypothetical protein
MVADYAPLRYADYAPCGRSQARLQGAKGLSQCIISPQSEHS